jgi:hypothetical protein
MLSATRWALCRIVSAAAFFTASAAHAQLVFTEVMHSPGGNDALWEWVEIVNIGSAPVDLDGWVFDDDDDGAIGGAAGGANISASLGNNTIVPAGGVAVLYPADELNFMTERFTNAWGGNITLIGVDGLTSLSAADAIGLWPSRASYDADAIPDVMTSPRRTFAGASAAYDYSAAPVPEDGHTIAWNGIGSPNDAANWLPSVANQLGAFASQQTTTENSQINSTADRGNPGRLPAGAASAGLVITEIMFAPDSPSVPVGFQEADFEWIEVLNNTPNPINFANTPYVFDDTSGSKLDAGNIRGGTIAAGATGILFNNEQIAREQMQAMWGDALTYIAVENWSSLNNSGGDTIALWDSYGDYNSEAMTGSPRTYANAVAAVDYGTAAGQGWPTIVSGRSIWLNDLSADPNAGESWTRAGASGDDLSFPAEAIYESSIDHPGGDVGSPGFVAGLATPTLPGDYDGDGTVDAADFIVWQKSDSSPNGYAVWRMNFGRTAESESAAASTAVPEPTALVLLVLLGTAVSVRRWRSIKRCLVSGVRRQSRSETRSKIRRGEHLTPETSIRRQGHQLFADRFDLMGRDLRQLIGKAHEQCEVAEAVDLPGHAVAQVMQRLDCIRREDFALRTGQLQPAADVAFRFLRRERAQQRFHGHALLQARQARDRRNEPHLADENQRQKRLARRFEVQQQPQRLQCPAVFQQMSFIDHHERVPALVRVLAEEEFQSANAFLHRVPRRIGRRRADLLRQIDEQIAARHLRKHEVHARGKGFRQLAAQDLHKHRFADAGRPGQHDGAAAILDRITQFEHRALVRFTRVVRAAIGSRFKRPACQLPILGIHRQTQSFACVVATRFSIRPSNWQPRPPSCSASVSRSRESVSSGSDTATAAPIRMLRISSSMTGLEITSKNAPKSTRARSYWRRIVLAHASICGPATSRSTSSCELAPSANRSIESSAARMTASASGAPPARTSCQPAVGTTSSDAASCGLWKLPSTSKILRLRSARRAARASCIVVAPLLRKRPLTPMSELPCSACLSSKSPRLSSSARHRCARTRHICGQRNDATVVPGRNDCSSGSVAAFGSARWRPI